MTVITLNNRIPEKTAVALGIFDGVHCGHRLIISHACDYGYFPAVFTFRTESVKVKHGKPFEYICTNDQKLHNFAKMGVEYVLSPDFDDIRNMTGEEFIKNILVGCMNVGAVVCGDNFRFGKDASCGVEELEFFGEKYGFLVEVTKLKENDFSSEKFRTMLRNGELSKENPYILYGEVVHGNQIGRTINFPTLNQNYATGQLVPKYGVYCTRTEIDGIMYNSITNVGVKPTVAGERLPLAETHILDFSGNLYGRNIEVEFCKFIRPEMKFSSVEELKKQISRDIAEVRSFI